MLPLQQPILNVAADTTAISGTIGAATTIFPDYLL